MRWVEKAPREVKVCLKSRGQERGVLGQPHLEEYRAEPQEMSGQLIRSFSLRHLSSQVTCGPWKVWGIPCPRLYFFFFSSTLQVNYFSLLCFLWKWWRGRAESFAEPLYLGKDLKFDFSPHLSVRLHIWSLRHSD